VLQARPVPLAGGLARAAADITWRLHLQPAPPGWVDLALRSPLMDTSRAHLELGWSAKHDARATLLEFLDGLRDDAGMPTPPLDSAAAPVAWVG